MEWAAMAGMLLLISGCGINNIPTQKQQVDAAWSQVLNEYQRRTDLIPNLVATVKGYAAHEASVLEAVTEARAKVTQTTIPPDILTNPQAFQTFERNQAALSGALSRLMVVTENYPNLKADQNFLALQSPWRAATTSSRCSSTTPSSPPFRAAGTTRSSTAPISPSRTSPSRSRRSRLRR
jgi:LemA protein